MNGEHGGSEGLGIPETKPGLGFGWRLEDAGTWQFEVRFEGSRIGAANDDAEHRAGVTLTARW